MAPETLALLIALGVALLIAVVQTLRIAWRGFSASWTARRRNARAIAGEARAEKLLRQVGCAILGRQVTTAYALRIDGERFDVSLRADYVVEIDERRFVAEVKTGLVAPRLDTAATRRQLLEYRVAFDVDGVLLVDAETGRVHAVEFPLQ